MDMKKLTKWALFAVVGSGLGQGALAAPSAVGTYGGNSADEETYVAFESTARGVIRRLEVAGLRVLTRTDIPGEPTQPLVERRTNITRRESGTFRLGANGRFSGAFVLNGRSRVDFQGATVRVSGNLRGRRGTITVRLLMDKTYADGSRQFAGGETTIRVRLPSRR